MAVTRQSKGWSESIRTAVNSTQRIRSIRFTNLHANEVGFSPYQSAETRNEFISISRYYGNRPLSAQNHYDRMQCQEKAQDVTSTIPIAERTRCAALRVSDLKATLPISRPPSPFVGNSVSRPELK